MSYLKNNKVLLLIIAILIVTNIGLLYFNAWKKPRLQHKSMKEVVMEKLEKEVGFTKQQLAIYDSIRTNHFKSMEPMFKELSMAKEDFFKLVNHPAVPDSVVYSYSSAISNKQQAIDSKMLRYFWSLKDICTEEQKPRMDSFLLNITKRMAGGGQRGPGPGRDKK